MNKLNKRFLSMVMAFALCMMPATAFAAEPSEIDGVETEAGSVAYVEADEVVTRSSYRAIWKTSSNLTLTSTERLYGNADLVITIMCATRVKIDIKNAQGTTVGQYSVQATPNSARTYSLGSGYPEGDYEITVAPDNGGHYTFEIGQIY